MTEQIPDLSTLFIWLAATIAITITIRLTLHLIRFGVSILSGRMMHIELHGIEWGQRPEYLPDIRAFSDLLIPQLRDSPARIIATPSHIYYLFLNAKTPSAGRCDELSSLVKRHVKTHPLIRQKGVWISVHSHPEIEESYKPYLNIYPQKLK